jgi:AbrB family looped-hinge helix DNA binding protein
MKYSKSVPQTVRMSSRNQIVIPSAARKSLDIEPGDRLLVDVQDGVLVLVPQPSSYSNALAGLHSDVWTDADSDDILDEERRAWTDSGSD